MSAGRKRNHWEVWQEVGSGCLGPLVVVIQAAVMERKKVRFSDMDIHNNCNKNWD